MGLVCYSKVQTRRGYVPLFSMEEIMEVKMTRQERRRLERKGIDKAELSRIIDYVVHPWRDNGEYGHAKLVRRISIIWRKRCD